MKQDINIVKDLIYWSYSNLAMAHMAVVKKQDSYNKINFMIRSRLFKGLKIGKMSISSIFDDEKIKIEIGKICNYCGSTENLTLEHIFPKKYGGKDNAENLILVCKHCNSSKSKKDLIEWSINKNQHLPLMIIRRYLKLVYNYCFENELLDKNINELKIIELPFKIELIPINFPQPKDLILNITDITQNINL